MIEFGKGNGGTDPHLEPRADAPRRLAENQRQAERQAEMAGELEQAAVLANKEHRHDGGTRLPQQLCGEGRPWQIDGRTPERLLRGRNAASWKDAYGVALGQPGLRGATGID